MNIYPSHWLWAWQTCLVQWSVSGHEVRYILAEASCMFVWHALAFSACAIHHEKSMPQGNAVSSAWVLEWETPKSSWPSRGTVDPQTCEQEINVCFSFFFFFGCTTRHAGSQFPNQGSNPSPLQWKRGVLTTGPPGKSPVFAFLNNCILGLFVTQPCHSKKLNSTPDPAFSPQSPCSFLKKMLYGWGWH